MSDNHLVFFIFFAALILYLVFKFFRILIKKRKWTLARNLSFPEDSRQILSASFHPYRFLSDDEKSLLELKINYFLLHKRIVGVGDFELSEKMRLLIAANACLLIVNLGPDEVFPGLKNIYVMRSSYIEKDNPINPYLGLPSHVERLGESWKRGPIVLSLESIKQSLRFPRQRQNLIIHEFSHHLDQQDGYFDGTPKLHTPQQFHLWAQVMGKAFQRLRTKVYQNKKSDIDAYGATNEAEFFAVCTEYFFTNPARLSQKHQAIFDLYLEYFKIDPRKWQIDPK